MPAAIALLRTSTDLQEAGLQDQRDAIVAHASAVGLQVVAWHTETLSGATPVQERPTLLLAISQLQPGMVLLAQKWDRITRDPDVASAIKLLVAKRHARIQVADGAGNGGTIMDEAMIGMLLVFAKLERGMIGARIKAALAVKKAQGVRLGRPPGTKDTKCRKTRSDKGVPRTPNPRQSQ